MVDPAAMLEGRTRETKIRRDREGRWSNDGVPIVHSLLVRAFDAWLTRAPDGSGRYCLSNDINWAFVEIEGPPRFVRRVREDGGELVLSLSDDKELRLDPGRLRQGGDGALYCDTPGELVARFDRHAMMQLEPFVREDARGVYLAIGGREVRPPLVADPLAVVGPNA